MSTSQIGVSAQPPVPGYSIPGSPTRRPDPASLGNHFGPLALALPLPFLLSGFVDGGISTEPVESVRALVVFATVMLAWRLGRLLVVEVVVVIG